MGATHATCWGWGMLCAFRGLQGQTGNAPSRASGNFLKILDHGHRGNLPVMLGKGIENNWAWSANIYIYY